MFSLHRPLAGIFILQESSFFVKFFAAASGLRLMRQALPRYSILMIAVASWETRPSPSMAR